MSHARHTHILCVPVLLDWQSGRSIGHFNTNNSNTLPTERQCLLSQHISQETPSNANTTHLSPQAPPQTHKQKKSNRKEKQKKLAVG